MGMVPLTRERVGHSGGHNEIASPPLQDPAARNNIIVNALWEPAPPAPFPY